MFTRIVISSVVFCVSSTLAFLGVRHVHALKPRIVVNPIEIDFGDVDSDISLEGTFTVTNVSKVDVTLDEFQPSCGCMSAIRRVDGERNVPLHSLTLKPGESARLATGIATGTTKGPLDGTVLFRTNVPNRPIVTVTMRAVVYGRLHAVPPNLHLGTVVAGDTTTVNFTLQDSGRRQPFVLSRVECTIPNTTVDTKAIDSAVNGELFHVSVHLPTPAVGPLKGTIQVYSANKDSPELSIPVAGRVMARCRTSPTAVVFPFMLSADRASYETDVFVSDKDGSHLPFQWKEAPPSWLQAEFRETSTGQVVHLSVPPAAQSEYHESRLTLVPIVSSGKSQPIDLPVYLLGSSAKPK